MEKLIKSKKRVKEHAEVYTPGFIVEQMSDLCEPDISDIHKRVLESACGNGAFLTRILKRRLEKCSTNFERLIALSNLYGVDIQADNVLECRAALLKLMLDASPDNGLVPCIGIGPGVYTEPDSAAYVDAATYILNTNIVVGDTINKPEEIWFVKYEPLDGQNFGVSWHCLAEMLPEDKKVKRKVGK